MTDLLEPGTVVSTGTLRLEHSPVPVADRVSGSPTTGSAEVGRLGDTEIGVWEISPGVSTDVEADEVFIVLTGRARIEFTEPALDAIEIGPGDIVRLADGMRTTWSVRETLRKVYLV